MVVMYGIDVKIKKIEIKSKHDIYFFCGVVVEGKLRHNKNRKTPQNEN